MTNLPLPLTVGAQISVGIGFEVGIVDFNQQLGFFIEAQADNSTAVMNLLSYGMYRHINSTFPTIAENLWGLGA